MKIHLQKSTLATATVIALMGGLCIPSIGMADTHGQGARFIGSASAPVWQDGIGEIAADRHTPEELAQMMRDYWTIERMRSAVPVDIVSPDGSVRALMGNGSVVADGGADEGNSPRLPLNTHFWTPERIRTAIPFELLTADGTVRALLADTGIAATGGADRGRSPVMPVDPDFWTPERMQAAIPFELLSADGSHRALLGDDNGKVSGDGPALYLPSLPDERDTFWTAERLRTAIPVELLTSGGFVRALLENPAASADTVRDAGSSPTQSHEPGFWTPERIREAIPVWYHGGEG